MKKQNGSSILTAPIIIAIGIIFLAILIVFTVNILTPYIWYEKLSSMCIKYIFIMEEYGYLTQLEQSNLIKELINQGFKEKNLRLDCTKSIQSYGSPIFLEIKYDYELNLPGVDNKIIPMKIDRYSVSKR